MSEAPARTVAELLAQCESLRHSEGSREKRQAEAKAKHETAKAEERAPVLLRKYMGHFAAVTIQEVVATLTTVLASTLR